MRFTSGVSLFAAFFANTIELTSARDYGQFESVSSELRQWFNDLKIPGTHYSCCNESDCRRTEGRIEGSSHFARAPDGAWVEVPEHAVLRNVKNPTAEAVLCALKIIKPTEISWHIYCFVPGPQM